jgi:hypothetical protein
MRERTGNTGGLGTGGLHPSRQRRSTHYEKLAAIQKKFKKEKLVLEVNSRKQAAPSKHAHITGEFAHDFV